MRRSMFVPVVLALTLLVGAGGLLAACGSSTPKASPGTSATGQQTGVTFPPAGANPSDSSKMVCAAEGRNEIASTLGMSETRVTTPTWVDHLYSCTYVYPKGSYTLSVKELSSTQETTDYFNSLAVKYGKKQRLVIGQGGFLAKNNDVVVRKDYKVLLVDVAKVPAGFVPAMTTSDVATNVAATIMSCWTDS